MAETDEALEELARHVAKVAGLRLGDRQRWLLEARVDARRAQRAETRAHYVARVLGGDDAELAALVEALRVGETRFFRHPRQLRALRRVALPELVARCEAEARPLRVWSAGCATGEEAYTLALLLRDACPDLPFEIEATDLSAEAIARAREGRYDAERTRDVPEAIAARDLERDGAACRVRDEARLGVRFAVHDLLRDAYPRGLDLVLCRNVLIYFDAPTRARVLRQLFGAVREGGYVALGYADHAGDVEGSEALRTDDGVLYRRTSGPLRVSEVPPRQERGSMDASSQRAHGARDVPRSPRRDPAPRTDARPPSTKGATSLPSRRGQPPTSSATRSRVDASSASTAREPRPAIEARVADPFPPARSSDSRIDRAPTTTARWAGELAGDEGLRIARHALAPVLAARGGALDLADLRFADDEVGRELARAAQALGERLVILAPSGGIERFLRRHGVVPPATLRRSA